MTGSTYGNTHAAISTDSQVGVGLRHPHYQDALGSRASIDFIEIHAENFLVTTGPVQAVLHAICEQYPVSLHGTSMGLGSAHQISPEYLCGMMKLAERINPILISDHACFTWSQLDLAGRSEGRPVHAGDLLPLEFTRESLNVLVDNVDRVQQLLGRQILVENISSYIEPDHNEMTETEFLSRLTERTNCGLLVDLNNVLVNLRNRPILAGESSEENIQTAARKWLTELPIKTIKEFHLAGHSPATESGLVIDDHSQPVSDTCWSLFRFAIDQCGPVPTLIEWDNDLPDWDTLVAQAQTARELIRRHTLAETFTAEPDHASV